LCCYAFSAAAGCCAAAESPFSSTSLPPTGDRPADVTALQKEIADITLPADLKPKQSMRMENFMFSMKLTIFESDDSKTSLMLTEMKAKMGGGQNPQQDAQMRDVMRQQGMEQGPLTNVQTTSKKIKVKGVEEDFKFSSGEDPRTGRKVRQVIGDFPGRKGDAHLIYRTEEESYKEEDVIKMLESIQ
jgi:hypothetical protein